MYSAFFFFWINVGVLWEAIKMVEWGFLSFIISPLKVPWGISHLVVGLPYTGVGCSLLFWANFLRFISASLLRLCSVGELVWVNLNSAAKLKNSVLSNWGLLSDMMISEMPWTAKMLFIFATRFLLVFLSRHIENGSPVL